MNGSVVIKKAHIKNNDKKFKNIEKEIDTYARLSKSRYIVLNRNKSISILIVYLINDISH